LNHNKNKPASGGVAIVAGGGPAGLMAAWQLAAYFEVHLFEKEKMVGQKFLLAGKGGLNITSHLEGEKLAGKYSPRGFMDTALNLFGPRQLREWLGQLGIPTYTGSSGKVFPEKGISPAQVLKAVVNSLQQRGVHIHTSHKLTDFDGQMRFTFLNGNKQIEIQADYAVLALGGASWPGTGSDGKWTEIMNRRGISTLPFQPSNCGVNIEWPAQLRQFHEGKPLKNIVMQVQDVKSGGEALITAYGLEGFAVYPLVPEIRKLIASGQSAALRLDLKPTSDRNSLLKRLGNTRPGSHAYARCLKLDAVSLALVKAYTSQVEFLEPALFADALKNLLLPVHSLRGLDEAISSTGGLGLESLNPDCSLKKFPRIFVAGEMTDWDAPTGGFLLQGCFSGGFYAANEIISRCGCQMT